VTEPLPRDWWTTRDVASYLQVSSSTIRAYVARGQMPPADRRIGRLPGLPWYLLGASAAALA
jgi:hypothetical protein